LISLVRMGNLIDYGTPKTKEGRVMFRNIFSIFFLLVVPLQARMWTDSTGKFSVDATIADYHNGVAYLQKDNGKFLLIPAAKLSQADQDFLKSTTQQVNLILGKVVGVTDGDTLTVLDETITYVRPHTRSKPK
jgi:hypothetical protein